MEEYDYLEHAKKGGWVKIGHKYVRREPNGKGGWRYYYKQKKRYKT